MSLNHQKNLCVVLGGGGHAKVVIDCMETSKASVPFCVLDQNKILWGRELLGVLIRGGDDLLKEMAKYGVTHFIVGVGGVRNNEPRMALFEKGLAQGLVPLTLQHPSVVCSPWAKVGRGTILCAGSIVSTGATLGDNVIVNTGAIIDHDCVIEDHVHIATGAKLSGTIRVGRGAHIGTGASIRQNIVIGEGAVVGAGAVVVKNVSPKMIVKGIPAR